MNWYKRAQINNDPGMQLLTMLIQAQNNPTGPLPNVHQMFMGVDPQTIQNAVAFATSSLNQQPNEAQQTILDAVSSMVQSGEPQMQNATQPQQPPMEATQMNAEQPIA